MSLNSKHRDPVLQPYVFRVGNLDCISLSDGTIPSPVAQLAPMVPLNELQDFLKICGENYERRELPVTCLLVKGLGRTILVDSGIGKLVAADGRPVLSAGRLQEALAAAGVRPTEIDTILISHIHPDHIGGLFDIDDNPCFPNARYFVPREEVAFWEIESPNFTGSLLPAKMCKEVIDIAHRFLALAGDKLQQFDAGSDPITGVRSVPLPGHTPGQVGYVFTSSGETLFYTADAAGHPHVSFKKPDWRAPFDADSEIAVDTRKWLINYLLEKGWYNFTPHFPWPSVGHLKSTDHGLSWLPLTGSNDAS